MSLFFVGLRGMVRGFLLMDRITLRLCFFLALGVLPMRATNVTLDFEGFPDSTVLTNQYPGVVFGNTIIFRSQFSLNEVDFPPRSGVNVASDNGGAITLTFDWPVLHFDAYFTYVTQLAV